MKTMHSGRLELKLTMQKRKFFEEIAALGGFKSLSDFIVYSANQEAIKIFEQHRRILASEKDKTIFFEAIMNPPNSNKALKSAFTKYKKELGAKWTIWLKTLEKVQ